MCVVQHSNDCLGGCEKPGGGSGSLLTGPLVMVIRREKRGKKGLPSGSRYLSLYIQSGLGLGSLHASYAQKTTPRPLLLPFSGPLPLEREQPPPPLPLTLYPFFLLSHPLTASCSCWAPLLSRCSNHHFLVPRSTHTSRIIGLFLAFNPPTQYPRTDLGVYLFGRISCIDPIFYIAHRYSLH